MNETLESLWSYCKENNRLCLNQIRWHEFFCMLKNVKQNPNGSWSPYLPPTSSEWNQIEATQKSHIFGMQLNWAADNHQLEDVGKYLRSLPEIEWVHYWEI